ncbi:lytic transglycosylase domain-containing protein [Yoonia sediminilitoris]|uniref:Soluble lytic murein transglycosylase n=1 Tax=Yoonia sediminilitoris TaxID=1286148 RepID=A0A2T6KAH5_9RHOB|nr:lytic transglycosylase domain-containing protein [Yoonia sediminilitoris]PUB11845.1 soluble lytic murein transglycosylase [Yoonia sediminilitoris]RCW91922.1 soluble lytic murein transglycosylase [Yoonia sediminilitoris]
MSIVRKISLGLAIGFAALPASARDVDPKAVAAIQAAETSWDAAAELAVSTDPVTRDVLEWLRLRAGEGTLADYQAFLAKRPDWPGLDRLRRAGEATVAESTADAAVLTYFEDATPQTGEGVVRYVQALRKAGKTEEAKSALRDAWLGLSLSDDGHEGLIEAFGADLAPFHLARVDAMLWRWRTTDATRMLPLLDADQRALAAARIGYITKVSNTDALVADVPAKLRQDAGLAYDRYNWLADRGERTEAVKVLLDRSTSAAALGEPFRWSGWRRSLARWEMREGRADQAYQLASRHYLTDGAAFADLEWLSGYIALTYLGNPAQALVHFDKAAAAVDSPISTGRMFYWIGRTQEVLRAPDKAAQAFGIAARHQTSFYGLLAAERLGRPLDPIWAQTPIVPTSDIFEQDIVRAAFLLLAAGERGHAVTFFAELGATLEPGALAQVGAALDQIDEQYYTLLLGKRAVRRGVMVPQNYFPLHDLANMDLPVEPALALSIARRESEFNIGVGSPVGALGLMQLMPATAEEVAGFLDLPYSRFRLTSDWKYNATLGGKYLSILQDEFGPTPVMIAAGYNAGPSRPKQWMDLRGDPRLGEMDVVDWIEHIPFRETRNYVQRVTESIPVYQARLTGQAGPIRFTELLRGEKPLLRPRARPLPQALNDSPDVRPVLRPERG